MSRYKIFDFGTSFIKVFCSKTNSIIRIKNEPVEVISIYDLKKVFLQNIDDDTEYIGISSQMHGFIVYDTNDNPVSQFITWKKQSDDILQNPIFDDFYLTGLQKRLDLPINNLDDFIKTNKLKNTTLKIKNLPEALLDISNNITHATMACGHGFYDIYTDKYIDKFINYFKTNYNIILQFDQVVYDNEVAGFINKNNNNIKVYVGLGDFQATLHGCKLDNNTLSVNLATGSQIALLEDKTTDYITNINTSLSYRPFITNKIVKCITHIPSGRFLNIYNDFFKELNIDMWSYFDTLTIEDLEISTLQISTNIFDTNGIHISHINSNNFNIKNLISSILYSYIMQYIELIRKYNFHFNKIVLSGGIAKKIKLIPKLFSKHFNHMDINIIDTTDDSILGVNHFITK